jgi:hypothetical protein
MSRQKDAAGRPRHRREEAVRGSFNGRWASGAGHAESKTLSAARWMQARDRRRRQGASRVGKPAGSMASIRRRRRHGEPRCARSFNRGEPSSIHSNRSESNRCRWSNRPSVTKSNSRGRPLAQPRELFADCRDQRQRRGDFMLLTPVAAEDTFNIRQRPNPSSSVARAVGFLTSLWICGQRAQPIWSMWLSS